MEYNVSNPLRFRDICCCGSRSVTQFGQKGKPLTDDGDCDSSEKDEPQSSRRWPVYVPNSPRINVALGKLSQGQKNER